MRKNPAQVVFFHGTRPAARWPVEFARRNWTTTIPSEHCSSILAQALWGRRNEKVINIDRHKDTTWYSIYKKTQEGTQRGVLVVIKAFVHLALCYCMLVDNLALLSTPSSACQCWAFIGSMFFSVTCACNCCSCITLDSFPCEHKDDAPVYRCVIVTSLSDWAWGAL